MNEQAPDAQQHDEDVSPEGPEQPDNVRTAAADAGRQDDGVGEPNVDEAHSAGAVDDTGESGSDEPSGEPVNGAGSGDEVPDVSSAEDAAADAGEPVTSAAPDLSEDSALDAALEALLLVVDVPAGEELLADTLGESVARVRDALRRMAGSYAESRRGIDLRRAGEGWRFYTRELYAPYVERYLLDGRRTKLTRAALETLAVVAYRQPVTRSRVAAVRGVNVDGVIRTLVGRGLIEEAGTDSETGGTLYCTTELFLERLGLSSLKDLPPLAPLLPEVDSIDDV